MTLRAVTGTMLRVFDQGVGMGAVGRSFQALRSMTICGVVQVAEENGLAMEGAMPAAVRRDAADDTDDAPRMMLLRGCRTHG